MIVAQFSTDNDLESHAIRWATNGQFSHVDLVLPDGLLGARAKGGVRLRPFDYKKFTARSRVACEVPYEDVAIKFARMQIGKPYNFKAILDMVAHRERSFTLDQPSWYCDEFVYAIALVGGVQLLSTDNPLGLTPQEVYLSPFWKQEPLS
jgi:hypothetical protein